MYKMAVLTFVYLLPQYYFLETVFVVVFVKSSGYCIASAQSLLLFLCEQSKHQGETCYCGEMELGPY